MKRLGIIILAAVLVGFVAAPAPAAVIDLFEYAFNIDGAVSNITLGDPVPAGVNLGGFNDTTGLGSITVTLSGAGMHYVGLFVDHEIDQAINTFFNEFGSAIGAPGAGQTWEIDEPGYIFGDIYDNFTSSALDNTNAINPGDFPLGEDVSMALAWDFSLAAGETALVSFLLSDTVVPAGFYLAQTDPDSAVPGANANGGATIYLSSTVEIRGDGEAPEPATLLLLGSGLVALAGLGRKRFKKA